MVSSKPIDPWKQLRPRSDHLKKSKRVHSPRENQVWDLREPKCWLWKVSIRVASFNLRGVQWLAFTRLETRTWTIRNRIMGRHITQPRDYWDNCSLPLVRNRIRRRKKRFSSMKTIIGMMTKTAWSRWTTWTLNPTTSIMIFNLESWASTLRRANNRYSTMIYRSFYRVKREKADNSKAQSPPKRICLA